jgi:hypothetical protein
MVHDRPGRKQLTAALARLAGIKGGRARAKKLSAEQRSDIAKKAAAARWFGHVARVKSGW